MALEFRKEIVVSSFLDPLNNFAERSIPIEFRYDPLTMDTAFLAESRARQPEKPELAALVTKSLETGCPFCPGSIDKVTPRFVPSMCPEGRIKVGEATVLPNSQPYAPYSAVTVLGADHFLGLTEFTPKMLCDALMASQTYLAKVHEYDPAAKYCCVLWNYMPPAQSSQIHPHLQVLVNYFPMAYHRKLLEASRRYRRENGANYWSDLIAEEKKLKERYIATLGNTIWLTSFVPKATFFDVMAIFQNKEAVTSLSLRDLDDFSQGLIKVFKYMDDENFYSFNLSLYSGVPKEDAFWTLARIVPRSAIGPVRMCDVGNFILLNETTLVTKLPESVCQELKRYFG